MKVHFISIHWLQFYPLIINEQSRFKKEHPAFKMLCEITDTLKEKTDSITEVKESINFFLETAGENPAGDLEYMTQILKKLQTVLQNYERSCGAVENLSAEKRAGLQKNLHRFAKGVRQEYWLSWLQDIYCCQIESALRRVVEETLRDDTEERLFIVTFPEFSFTDFLSNDYVAFYKETAYKFLRGELPTDIPRTGVPLQTLAKLTTAFRTASREVLIFAGTIMWRDSKFYYNMAPVFFQGECVYVWEKQQISHEDGKSYQDKHRHPVCFGQKATYHPPYRMHMAGSLTVNFLAEKGFEEVKPVFGLDILGKKIRFAVTICLDMNDPSILGNETADIHILMAAGMNCADYCENIRATSLFLYCDSSKGRTAMYKLGDRALWSFFAWKEWKNIDREAVIKRYQADPAQDIVRGIYIAPNIEEI